MDRPPARSHPPPPPLPLTTVLVANRGEIAVRLIRAVHALNLRAVAVYAPADSHAAHVKLADAAHAVPTYLDVPALVAAGKACGAGAVLPGYGFVSEDSGAVAAFEGAGIVWAGPAAETVDVFGGKVGARIVAEKCGVPCVPGSGVVVGVEEAVAAAVEVGWPVLVKASAGGGGMGQAIARDEASLRRVFEGVVEMGERVFGSGMVYVERFVEEGRHVEVQVFGNGKGEVCVLGDRDCSVQRRRQKVLEEAPARLEDDVRKNMWDAARRLCATYCYRSAGTVEFLVDVRSGEWYFLEVNTRLQVEHGCTELCTGVDIARWMVLLAAGVDVLKEVREDAVVTRGCALESRVYAEVPARDYAPCPGKLSEMGWPKVGDDGDGGWVRVDSWAVKGSEVSSFYDPLLGKVLVWGRTRRVAVEGMRRALAHTVVRGVESNVPLLKQICDNEAFEEGIYTTSLLTTFAPRLPAIEVVSPGLQSSVQDWPGRLGYWNIGVSPSGAMDAYAMGLANAAVGNEVGGAALEMTVLGPTLKFGVRALVALTGAIMEAEVDDGKLVPWWTPFWVEAGSVLYLGRVAEKKETGGGGGGGKISYLAVGGGGLAAPKYLGSASTFPTGSFGGFTGGFLKAGDFLPLTWAQESSDSVSAVGKRGWPVGESLPTWLTPDYSGSDSFVVGAINGPHGSDDFLTPTSLDAIWTSSFTVHHAANRLGVRLIGPTPSWVRTDGGSAGLHPSNLHDYVYAPGALNFSGNTPIVLMLDGPSLGGFICPITVSKSELWKVAQAAPGSTIRFKQVPHDDSLAAGKGMLETWDAVRCADMKGLEFIRTSRAWSPQWAVGAERVDLPAVAASLNPATGDDAEIKVVYRMSGDEHVLIEYGEIDLDLAYRMRVHMLMEQLEARPYILELCPGVRSVLVKYDPAAMHMKDLLAVFKELELGVLGSVHDLVVPSRVIRLPMAFDDKWSKDAQERYMHSVRPDAPYMPSNVEFVRRINGLSSTEDVKKTMLEAEYLVLGRGDVYLSAPLAVPINCKHRLVTSKYNPARIYTPEGAVGIGGAYLCIYGMDSPGGYQLTGRTLPIWDNYGQVSMENRGAPPEVPWFLRLFDRICFYDVSDVELETLRDEYRRGHFKLDISDGSFSFREYEKFCAEDEEGIKDFKEMQETAFADERARWDESGEGENSAAAEHAAKTSGLKEAEDVNSAGGGGGWEGETRPPFSVSVLAGVAATVWSIDVADGDSVERGQSLVTLESMKVEISVQAPVAGTVVRLRGKKGDSVQASDEICLVVSTQEQAMNDLSLKQLRSMYKLEILEPAVVIKSSLAAAREANTVFVSTTSWEECKSKLVSLADRRKSEYLPLYGVPFSVAASVDVAGLVTTNGLKGLSMSAAPASVSADIVLILEAAGGILIGQTNMDEYNGVTGCFSSFGTPDNPYLEGCVSGGGFGAAIAVAKSFVSFAVHVDSAGSAIASPGIVCAEGAVLGLKVTEGLLSLSGTTSCCPGLDSLLFCVNGAADLGTVLEVCQTARHARKSSSLRSIPASISNRPPLYTFTVGAVPSIEHLAYHSAVQKLCQIGGTAVDINFEPFSEVNALFDDVPLDAARYGALSEKLKEEKVLDETKLFIVRSRGVAAASLSAGLSALQRNMRLADSTVWPVVNVVAIPTVDSVPKLCDVAGDVPAAVRALTKFTRFIAPMDLCSVTVGDVTLVAPPLHEADLVAIAGRW